MNSMAALDADLTEQVRRNCHRARLLDLVGAMKHVNVSVHLEILEVS